jgi:carbonic anhydrase/acetyltransferase-like protein (isoleucine patch superfamily)
LHACIVEDNAFIGMQATVMDKAVVEEYGFIGAGSLVSPGKIVKKKELWMGRPAKFVRMITDEELEFMQGNIKNYLELSNEYKK